MRDDLMVGDNNSIMDDFWGRAIGLFTEFPFLNVPPIDADHILSGYKEGEKGYVWSCVHGHCGNAPGYEWSMNAPIIWVPGRLMDVPCKFVVAIMCLPFFLLMGAICWIGELLGKKRGWAL